MSLSATRVRSCKAQAKPYKLFDEKGLFLLVQPTSAKYWRFKYRYGGKEKLLSMGTYPEVSLKAARERRDDARKLVVSGVDPSAARRAEHRARTHARESSFERVAYEWFARKEPNWVPSHSSKIRGRLDRYLIGYLGDRPIDEITAPEILEVLRKIEVTGKHETVRRVRQVAAQVFAYAIAIGSVKYDPTAGLAKALTVPKQKHFAAITDPAGIGDLMRAIYVYDGTPVVCAALKLAPVLFVRPGELRRMEWSELNLDEAMWRIPGPKMKMKRDHLVPLATQALDIIADLKPLNDRSKYVLPSARGRSRPMSENAVTVALRNMEYTGDQMTGHGFRHMASTLLHEQGWPTEVVEKQLAHADKNAIRAIYNAAEYLPKRQEMMQAWADYLDGLRNGGEVVSIGRTTA